MLKRGFKSWAEQASVSYRKELGLDKTAPLAARDLAAHLRVKLLTPKDVPGLSEEAVALLLGTCANNWSAVAIVKGHRNAVIYNSAHSQARQSNDIMHELSHIIIGHTPQTTQHSIETDIFLRNFDTNQEEEADWLAGVLLLPKDVLIKIRFSGMSEESAAQTYGSSKSLLTMRLNRSGINHIYSRSKKS